MATFPSVEATPASEERVLKTGNTSTGALPSNQSAVCPFPHEPLPILLPLAELTAQIERRAQCEIYRQAFPGCKHVLHHQHLELNRCDTTPSTGLPACSLSPPLRNQSSSCVHELACRRASPWPSERWRHRQSRRAQIHVVVLSFGRWRL